RVVDLSTCRETTQRPAKAASELKVVVARHDGRGTEAIVFRGRTVLTVHEDYARAPRGYPGPILLEGTSPDKKWILYAIDPQGSASLIADGIMMQAVRATGGRSYTVASGLGYADYRAWCASNLLVVTAGGDRIASDNKRLIVTGP